MLFRSIPPLQLTDKNGNLRPAVDLQGKFYLLEDLDAEYVKDCVNVDLRSEERRVGKECEE